MGFWDQLNTLRIGNHASTAITRQSDPVHLQESNREVLKDIVLVNEANQRNGLPMAGTGSIKALNVTSSGAITSVFTPDYGEVYRVVMIGGQKNGGSGAVIYEFYLYDGTTRLKWFYYSSSDSGVLFTGDSNYTQDIYLTGPSTPNGTDGLVLQVEATGTFDSVDFQVAVVRVR